MLHYCVIGYLIIYQYSANSRP